MTTDSVIRGGDVAKPDTGSDETGLADIDLDEAKTVVPKANKPYYDNASCWSRWTYSWVDRVFARSKANKLTESDLKLPQDLGVQSSHTAFAASWEAESKSAEPSLRRAIVTCFSRDVLRTAVFKLLWSCFLLLSSFYFVRSLVDFVSEKAPRASAEWVGYALAVAFLFSCAGMCIFQQQMNASASMMATRLRAALMTAIYRKAMSIENIQTEVSDVLNLATTDVGRLAEACTTFHLLWGGPLEIAGMVGLLIYLVGPIGWVAGAMMVLSIPLFLYIGKSISKLRAANIKATDHRVHVMQEVLSAIKLVKLYAYEQSFYEAVQRLRQEELVAIRAGQWIKTFNLMVVFLLPPFVALVIFPLYLLSNSKLTASIAFTTLSLFNTARIPLVVLPRAIQNWAEALHAVQRIQRFLLRPEIHTRVHAVSSNPGVSMKNVSIGYLQDPRAAAHNVLRESLEAKQEAKEVAELNQIKLEALPKPTAGSAGHSRTGSDAEIKPESIVKVMDGVSFEVKAGETMAIVGAVAAGKTAIIEALLGEARTLSGTCSISGSLAYLPQTPWVQAGTIRENITFGRPFNRERYNAVTFACALTRDFEILPNGDLTLCAERGINLSGGQRQRISLARAVYSDAQVYLLDGPLSAVDWSTSNHIMTHCFKGLLREKTVILVTHQLHLLEKFDHICIVRDKRVVYHGKHNDEIMRQEFASWQKEKDEIQQKKAASAAAGGDHKQAAETTAVVTAAPTTTDNNASDSKKSEFPGARTNGVGLVATSPKQISMRSPWTVWAYAGGIWLFLSGMFSFCVAQVARIMSDWWISAWTADRFELDNQTYIWVYACLVFAFALWIFIRGAVMYLFSAKAATNMHNAMYERVLGAPMSFFTLTPIGGLLSGFGKDQDVLDETLPDTWHMTTIYANILLTTVILVSITLPLFTVMILLLIIAFSLATYYYLSTTVQLKTLVNETSAPLLAQFTETLTGVSVVRAFDAQPRFAKLNQRLLDRAHATAFTLEQVQLWLGFRIDTLSELLVFATALLCVAFRSTTSPSVTGLAISSSLQMLLFFTWVMRGMAEIASLMTSVDRISALTESTPQEAAAVTAVRPNEQWPLRGGVSFHHCTMRYLPGFEPALKDVTLTINPGEKIGVVGRTGSGKTSLLMALFRLVEVEGAGARIEVDGDDTSKFGLRDLRAKLAIIPQEPVMFKGTVRSNLDPFHRASEAQLWDALHMVFLADKIKRLPDQLDAIVEDNGQNFSLGERQLMCLARAKLNPSKVLVLDEASAALDLQTDQLIQAAIKRSFADRTVITIAHRLDSIITSDRILCMDAGRVAEFDTPKVLLTDPNSFFSKLVDQAGDYRDTLRAVVMDEKNARRQFQDAHSAGNNPMLVAPTPSVANTNTSFSFTTSHA